MKRSSPNLRQRGALILLALATLMTTGCIEARHTFYYRYDEAKDTFSYLHMFSDIASDQAGELSYLYALTQKKQDIIVLPLPAILGPPPAFVRLGNRQVNEVNIATPPPGFKDKLAFPKPTELPVDISGIKIKPGAFFLNERKNLCYYHETEIPGSVADQLLVAMNKEASRELIAKLDEMIKADGDPDLPRISWDDLRKQLADKIKNEPPKKVDPKKVVPITRGPLDLASLKMLRKAAAADELGLKRKGSRLLLRVPLTKADAQQVVATLDFVKKSMLEEIGKNGKDIGPGVSEEDAKKLLAAVKATINDGVSYKLDPEQGILLEAELAKMFTVANLFNDITERMPFPKGSADADMKYQVKCRAALTSIEGRKVEILRTFDANKLRAPYLSFKK